MIEGLSHITLVVKDLGRAAVFPKTAFDAEEVYSSGVRTFSLSREKFFLASNDWLAAMEGDSLREKTYDHVAFRIPDADFDTRAELIRSLRVEIRESRSRVPGEGKSRYFFDRDNHLFELHAGTPEQGLAACGAAGGKP